MIGRLHHFVLDCPDPAALARLDGEDVFADPAGHPFCLVKRPGWASLIPPG